MRLSVNKELGFRQTRPGVYMVTMDGKPLQRVVKVDTGSGVAWVADTDRAGNVRIDRQKQEVILRRVYGPMRLERIDGLPVQGTPGMDPRQGSSGMEARPCQH